MITKPEDQTSDVKVDNKSGNQKSLDLSDPVEKKVESDRAKMPRQPKLPPKLKPWLIGIAALGLLAIPVSMYISNQKNKSVANSIDNLIVRVQPEDLTVKINASGTVQPVQRVNLSPKNSGRIAELYVEQGDLVKQGQAIARMESDDIRAQLAQAQARLASAQARLNKLQAGSRSEEIASAAAQLAQNQASLAELRAGSRVEEIAAAQARLNQSQAKLSQLRAGNRVEEIAAAKAQLQQTEAKLSQLRAGNRSEDIAKAKASLAQAELRLNDAENGSLRDEISQAEARLRAAEAAQDLAMQRLNRNQTLKEEGAIAEFTFEEYKKEARVAEANVNEAKKKLEQMRVNLISEINQLRAGVESERQNVQLLEKGTRPEEIAQAEATVAEARSKYTQMLRGTRSEEIANAEAAVAEAQSNLDKLVNGARPEEIARSQAAVTEAKSRYEQTVNGSRPEDIAQAEADVAEAIAQVRFQEVQLDDSTVRAPFDGIITQRYAIQGAFVTPTTSASAADSAASTSIVALAKDLEVLAKVPEADIPQIRKGQTVEITADAYPDQSFTGKVRIIAPEAVKERDVTLFQVRITISQGKAQLQAGMNVDLQFFGEKLNNALVIPTVAIVTHKGKTGVLIPDAKNQPKFQQISIGSTIGNKIQVLSGLKTGDRVFIELPQGKKLEDIFKK